MTFAASLTRVPRPFNKDRGTEARGRIRDIPPELGELIEGAAGCSPYLAGLIEREADWLAQALSGPVDAAFDALLSDVEAAEDGDLKVALRRAKRRVALLTALADLGGVWSLEQVTRALTRFADAALSRALLSQVAVEIRRGKLPGQTEEDIAVAGGMTVLAMGKMGAFELNYSSDIDLICLFDEERFDGDTFMEARSAFVRATRCMCALLSNQTGGGYVFRTDLRLRPDPSVTPVCMTMAGALRYYEQLGRTWERAAHIKARPAAGDIEAGERYLTHLRPFVWRRHLDFAAIQDAHDMRLRIRDHKGLGGPITLAGHDMKLGRGGIREIEFFTQTRQIIAGGRDPSLRVRGTIEGLERLVAAGWVDGKIAAVLSDDYRFHREIEHRLQMTGDQQTQELPHDDEGFARLAAYQDREVDDLRDEISDRLSRVSSLTEGFFAPSAKPDRDSPELTEAQAEIVARWRGYPALRSERALDIFDRIKPGLLRHLMGSPRADQALVHFDGFLAGLPAGVQLFSLFEANPQLGALLADIAGTTPDLAQYLSRNSAVLDAVIGGSFFDAWPGLDRLRDELASTLARQEDYEKQLDAARGWARDWHFRIGVHHLRHLIGGADAGEQYADLAEAVVSTVWPAVVEEFARKHGPPPGEGAMVLGMGSIGAGRLTARSDLDLIVIYDAAGVESSEGRRPLSSRTYYARLTQALVTALSAPMSEGRLYEVDMRLRPSGRQGPVATALAAFESYQREEAWTWEHLALTRARPIAGPRPLCDRIEALREAVLTAPHDAEMVLQDASDMRARLLKARPGSDWDARAGRGRLQDIELFATVLGLLSGSPSRGVSEQFEAGRRSGLITDDDLAALCAAHGKIAGIQSAMRLLSDDTISPDEIGAAGEALILSEAGCDSMEDVRMLLADHAGRADAIINRVLDSADAKDHAETSEVRED